MSHFDDKPPPVVSEIAQFRAQMEREHQMMQWAATGLVGGAAKHLYISRRYQSIGKIQGQLAGIIGEQQAVEVMCEVVNEAVTSPPPVFH